MCLTHAQLTRLQNLHVCWFNPIKGNQNKKLLYLLDVRDRQLDQPIDSPYRIKEVCDQLPETLDGVIVK